MESVVEEAKFGHKDVCPEEINVDDDEENDDSSKPGSPHKLNPEASLFCPAPPVKISNGEEECLDHEEIESKVVKNQPLIDGSRGSGLSRVVLKERCESDDDQNESVVDTVQDLQQSLADEVERLSDVVSSDVPSVAASISDDKVMSSARRSLDCNRNVLPAHQIKIIRPKLVVGSVLSKK